MNIIKKIIAYFRIPRGMYCYHIRKVVYDPTGKNYLKIKTKCCPYWDKLDGYNDQESGYCHYLGYGDMDINNDEDRIFTDINTGEETSAPDMPIGVGLLWDQCKECGIKPDWRDVWWDICFKWEKLIKPKNKYGLIKLSKKQLRKIFTQHKIEYPFLLISSFKYEFFERWDLISDEIGIIQYIKNPLLDECKLFYLRQDIEEQLLKGGIVLKN